MVNVAFHPTFEEKFKKIRDELLRTKVKKQIQKIIGDPLIGKPMRYLRKGTREVYVKPFRLSYFYEEQQDRIVFLDLYHKDEQ